MDSQIKKKLLKLKDESEREKCADLRYFYNNYCKQSWEPEVTEREFEILTNLYKTMSGRLRKLFCTMAKISHNMKVVD